MAISFGRAREIFGLDDVAGSAQPVDDISLGSNFNELQPYINPGVTNLAATLDEGDTVLSSGILGSGNDPSEFVSTGRENSPVPPPQSEQLDTIHRNDKLLKQQKRLLRVCKAFGILFILALVVLSSIGMWLSYDDTQNCREERPLITVSCIMVSASGFAVLGLLVLFVIGLINNKADDKESAVYKYLIVMIVFMMLVFLANIGMNINAFSDAVVALWVGRCSENIVTYMIISTTIYVLIAAGLIISLVLYLMWFNTIEEQYGTQHAAKSDSLKFHKLADPIKRVQSVMGTKPSDEIDDTGTQHNRDSAASQDQHQIDDAVGSAQLDKASGSEKCLLYIWLASGVLFLLSLLSIPPVGLWIGFDDEQNCKVDRNSVGVACLMMSFSELGVLVFMILFSIGIYKYDKERRDMTPDQQGRKSAVYKYLVAMTVLLVLIFLTNVGMNVNALSESIHTLETNKCSHTVVLFLCAGCTTYVFITSVFLVSTILYFLWFNTSDVHIEERVHAVVNRQEGYTLPS